MYTLLAEVEVEEVVVAAAEEEADNMSEWELEPMHPLLLLD